MAVEIHRSGALDEALKEAMAEIDVDLQIGDLVEITGQLRVTSVGADPDGTQLVQGEFVEADVSAPTPVDEAGEPEHLRAALDGDRGPAPPPRPRRARRPPEPQQPRAAGSENAPPGRASRGGVAVRACESRDSCTPNLQD